MSFEDLSDLKAYLGSLPAVKSEVPEHDLTFPFNIRPPMNAAAPTTITTMLRMIIVFLFCMICSLLFVFKTLKVFKNL